MPFTRNKSYTDHPSNHRYRYVPAVLVPITNLLAAPASLVKGPAVAHASGRNPNRYRNSENPNGNQ